MVRWCGPRLWQHAMPLKLNLWLFSHILIYVNAFFAKEKAFLGPCLANDPENITHQCKRSKCFLILSFFLSISFIEIRRCIYSGLTYATNLLTSKIKNISDLRILNIPITRFFNLFFYLIYFFFFYLVAFMFVLKYETTLKMWSLVWSYILFFVSSNLLEAWNEICIRLYVQQAFQIRNPNG